MHSLEVKKPEILAPAGDDLSFFAAINNGCSAVYLGIDAFNARIKAKNFTLLNLEYYVNYAHLMNVKVYLTLNTIIHDSEFAKLEEIIKTAVKINIDAFIVQDLGVFFMIKSLCKDIPVHASTQLGVCNLEGALFCQKLGFSRVILARETTLFEIERITKNCKIETEVFVHGALCVSVSGQCYLSSFIFSKSGNRGECLQPCRKFYTVLKDNIKITSGYMLSTSDLCLANHITKLTQLNVTSFKIEGRMKRPEYVAECVKLYRNILDDNNYKIDLNPVKKLYNRGDYTTGYLYADNKLMSKNLQGHKGVYIGKIIEIKNDKLLVESDIKLSFKDGFKILNDFGYETGNAVFCEHIAKNKYTLLYKGKVNIGQSVYITTDFSQIEEINKISKKISVAIEFTVNESGIKINVKCDNENDEFLYDIQPEEAKNQPLTYKTVFDIFNKLKETPFEIENFKLDAKNFFIPLSKLNELKKDVFDKLSDKILKSNGFLNNYKISEKLVNLKQYKNCDINIAIVNDNLIKTQNVSCVVFKPQDYVKAAAEKFLENYKSFDNKFLYIPAFLTQVDIKLLKDMANGFSGFYLNNPGHLELDFIKDKKIIIGEGFNVLNAYAVMQLENIEKLDIYCIVLSKEIALKDSMKIKLHSKFPVSIFVYGYLEAMQLNHCVIKNIYNNTCKACKYSNDLYIEDERHEKFKIYRRKLDSCYFILNNKKLNALKHLKNEKIGFVFDFSFDSTVEIVKIQEYYANKFIKNDNPEFNFTDYTKGSLFRSI